MFSRSATASARSTRTRGVLSGVALLAAAGLVLVTLTATPSPQVMAESASLPSQPRPGQALDAVSGQQAELVRDDIIVHTPTPTPTPTQAPVASGSSNSSSGSSNSGSSESSGGSSSAASIDIPVAAAPNPGSAQAVARQMLQARGWGENQYACLYSLWQRESNWNVYAQNPSSGAYGIPQSLPGSKMATAGADWRTNPVTQISWGLSYISGRYGTPCGAWGHSQAVGWY